MLERDLLAGLGIFIAVIIWESYPKAGAMLISIIVLGMILTASRKGIINNV